MWKRLRRANTLKKCNYLGVCVQWPRHHNSACGNLINPRKKSKWLTMPSKTLRVDKIISTATGPLIKSQWLSVMIAFSCSKPSPEMLPGIFQVTVVGGTSTYLQFTMSQKCEENQWFHRHDTLPGLAKECADCCKKLKMSHVGAAPRTAPKSTSRRISARTRRCCKRLPERC